MINDNNNNYYYDNKYLSSTVCELANDLFLIGYGTV